MTYTRRFLLSPALARLIRKERGTQGRVFEGYFANTRDRTHFVRMDPPICQLVLLMQGPEGKPVEEATELPRSQAQALMDVAQSKITYNRTRLALSPAVEGVLEEFLSARPFDLLTLAFKNSDAAEHFQPPLWTGVEVSGDPAFEKHAIALGDDLDPRAPEISNAALADLLDFLEGHRVGSSRTLRSWDSENDPANPSGEVLQAPNTPPPGLPRRSADIDEKVLAGLAMALGSTRDRERVEVGREVSAESYPVNDHGARRAS